MNKSFEFCSKCCLTVDYPNVKFKKGVCNYCEEFNYYEYKNKLSVNKKKLKTFLEDLSKKKIRISLLSSFEWWKGLFVHVLFTQKKV